MRAMDDSPQIEALRRTLRKLSAALHGVGRRAVAIGPVAWQAYGVACETPAIDLLIPPGEQHRPMICGAARGEGLQEAPGEPGLLRFRYTDAKLGATGEATLREASTPLLLKTHERAQDGVVLRERLALAACEDLILLLAASGDDEPVMIELLRRTAGRMDAPYLKAEAEKAGLLDKVKSVWQKARQG